MSSSKHFTDSSPIDTFMDLLENQNNIKDRNTLIKNKLTFLTELIKQLKIEKNWIIAGFMFIILLMISLFVGFYVNKDIVWRPKNLCTLP